MKTLLISRPLPAPMIQAAQEFLDVTVRESNAPLTANELRAALKNYDAILPTLRDEFNADVFRDVTSPRAKILANFGVGYNHIDTTCAQAHGITVTNTPGAVTDATADTAMTLLLMSARRAAEGERLVRSGQWHGWHPTQMLGLHITGKTVGIIGMGRIGQAIARRCHFGFGMDVMYANRSEKQMDFPSTQVPIETLAERADIVVCAAPGGAETHHLIGKSLFDLMQPHAHFINIARGDIVDEAALIDALKNGRIGGAGLDVYEFEPTVSDALRALENVTLLPHLGTAALEVRMAMGHMAIDNLRAYFAGGIPPNLV